MNFNQQMKQFVKRCDEALVKENLKKLLHEAKQEIEEIEEVELENMLFIDVREEDEFASGTIPAKNILTIPRGKIEFAIDKILENQDKKIVCYCLKGARGLLAAYTLKKLGIEAYNLKGGILEWVNRGNKIRNYLGEFKKSGD